MSGKISELPSEKRRAYRREMENLDSSRFESDRRRTAIGGMARFGICAQCLHMSFAKTDFSIAWALCTRWDHAAMGAFRLNSKRPLQNCTEFNRRGFVSLYDMQDIAWIIDISEKKAGF